MADYEFSEKDNERISGLANVMKWFGLLVALGGAVSTLFAIVGLFTFGFGLESILGVINGIVLIAFGLAFYLPTDNLKRIATTEGNDIPELMTALGEMNNYLGVTLGLIILDIILVIVRSVL